MVQLQNEDGIPPFLKLSRERRAAAWESFSPRAAQAERQEPNGPGSTARRLGFPESPRDAEALRELVAIEAHHKALKRAVDETRFATMREKARQDKADRASVAAAVRRRGRK